jgi:hypothetical protein
VVIEEVFMRDYAHLYSAPRDIAESVIRLVTYADPVHTEDQRRAHSAHLAATRATLRRARRGELTLVYVLAALTLLTMLPAVIAAAGAWAAATLWRRRRHVGGVVRRHTPTITKVLQLPGRAAGSFARAGRAAFHPPVRPTTGSHLGSVGGGPSFHTSEGQKEIHREIHVPVRPRHTGQQRRHRGSPSRATHRPLSPRTPPVRRTAAAGAGGSRGRGQRQRAMAASRVDLRTP